MNKTLIERRSLIKMGAFALAGSAMPLAGCASQTGSASSPARTVLPRVRVEEDRIIRRVGGLRPFRPSGFVVRSEKIGQKTVIHNYGHGGCGVTLSWGTADTAAKLAAETPFRQVAVIGAGAVGLATARLLQDRGFDVNLYARDVTPNTTSDIAGALFGVTTIVDEAHETPEITASIQKAVRFAHRKFQTMTGEKYGVRWLEVYMIGEDPQTRPWDFEITPEIYPLRQLKEDENPFSTRHASVFATLEIEPHTYLARVTDDFLMRGGKLEIRDFPSQAEMLRLKEPLIVNCTGLASRTLFNDPELIPVKGQLTFLLPQPEINYSYIDGKNFAYMFPRSDGILLGGSHDKNVDNPEPEEKEAKRIFDAHKQLSAGMKS